MQNAGKIDPKLLQQLAQKMNQIGQKMGKGDLKNMAQMDMKALQQLMDSLKNGNRPNGKLPGNVPGQMPGLSPSQMKSMRKNPMQANRKGKGNGIGSGSIPDDMQKYLEKISKNPPNTKVKGKRNGPSDDIQITTTGDPDPTKSSTPYYQVYQASKRAAESTLTKENIPANYREQVRDYFDSIRP